MAETVKDGLIGLNRDIILQLIRIVNDPTKTRMILGMCKQMFCWRLHSFFLKIRRESRGIVSTYSTPCKKKLLLELNRKIKKDESIGNGELGILFAILPNPSQKLNTEKEELFIDTFESILRYTISSSKVDINRCFFAGNGNLRLNLLNWLLVFMKKSESKNNRISLAAVIAHFHTDSNLPKNMKCIIPLLVDLKEHKKIKARALISLCQNEGNLDMLLIDNRAVSSLVPYLSDNAMDCSYLLMLLCNSKSLKHRNMIIDTPNLLSNAAQYLTECMACFSTNYRGLKCLELVIKALGNCCCPFEYDSSKDDGERKEEDINRYALEQCALHGIPALALRIVAEMFSRFHVPNFQMASSAAALPSLFAGGVFNLAADILAALKKSAERLCNKYEFMVDSPLISATFYLVRLCDRMLIPHLLSGNFVSNTLNMMKTNMSRLSENPLYCYKWCDVLYCFCAYGSVLAGTGKRNAIVKIFEKHSGMGCLVELECLLRGKALKQNNNGQELKYLEKARDKACLCLCHLLKNEQIIATEQYGAVLQHAKRQTESGAAGWEDCVWREMAGAEEALREYENKK